MSNLIFSNDMFTSMILKIFLPILVIVIVVKIVIDIYAIRARKKQIENIDEKIKFHSTLISIVITIILLAIAVSFSVNFFNLILKNKIVGNKYILYTISIICPLIPILFLVYLIPKFVKLVINEDNHNKKIKNHSNKKINNSIISDNISTKKEVDDEIECI